MKGLLGGTLGVLIDEVHQRKLKVTSHFFYLEGGRDLLAAGADFLVLGADPLADVQNARSLESVGMAGNRAPARG